MLSSVMKTMKWCVWEGIIFIMKKSRYADVYDRQNEELQPEPQEKYEDQAVKDFRKIIADKKETRKEPAAPSVFHMD